MLLGYYSSVYSVRREQPHNFTLKHGCGFSYSWDQGTTNDMPIHTEPLGQAAQCDPILPIPTRFFPQFQNVGNSLRDC